MYLVRTDIMSRKNTKTTANKGYSPEVRIVLRGTNKSKVPEATRRFIDTLKHFRDKPYMLESLRSLNSPYRDMQRRARVKAFRVLTVLISYMDWATFRIGVPNPDSNDPVKHKAMIKRYKKMYNEAIPNSTWYNYINQLIQAGYLSSTPMDMKDREGKIRGAAGLKCITMKLMTELNFKPGWIDEQRNYALQKLKQRGLSNVWPKYSSKLANEKREKIISDECIQTESALGEFETRPNYLDFSPSPLY